MSRIVQMSNIMLVLVNEIMATNQ